MSTKKIILPESEMPTQWYNVVPHIPNGLLPPLDPATGQPAGRLFAQTEGIIPAPDTCHAIRAAIIEATPDLKDPKTICSLLGPRSARFGQLRQILSGRTDRLRIPGRGP